MTVTDGPTTDAPNEVPNEAPDDAPAADALATDALGVHPGEPLFIRAVRLPEPRRGDVRRRLARAVRSTATHLLPLAARAARSQPISDRDTAHALRKVFEDMGGTFTKFGQLLASAPSLFGDDVAGEFRGLLDSVPPEPWAQVRDTIEDELGWPVDTLFAELDPVPLAAASLAQVHRAVLPDGRVVAVKVLRPGIEERMAVDLAVMTPLFDLLGREVAVGIFGELPSLVAGLAEQLSEEVDLRNEARTMVFFEHIRAVLGLDNMVVPAPVEGYQGKRVLVMTFIEGVAIDDLSRLGDLGIDPAPLVQDTVKAWFASALCTGAFHGDVHAGNLLVTPDERLAVLDWGIVGRLDPDTQRFFRRTVEGAMGDDSAWPDVYEHMTSIYGTALRDQLGLTDEQAVALIRMQIEPIFSRPFGEIRLTDLLATTDSLAQKAREAAPSTGDEVAALTAAARRGAREAVALWRSERRRRRDLIASGAHETSFDRAMFLLGKQLVYFDRYGKLFLPDVPILWEREAFERLLAEPVVPAESAGRQDP